MRIFHIDLAYTKGWSGGDNCTFETIRYLSRQNVENIHITTENCSDMYQKKGLQAGSQLKTLCVPDFCEQPEGISLFVAFFKRIRAAKKIIKTLELHDSDRIILHNEFFVNSIPGWWLSAKNLHCPVFYWLHMLSPDLFKGFEGQFTGKHRLPSPALFHFWFSQRLQARLMRKNGKIISHNPAYADELPQRFPRCGFHLIYPYSGVPSQFLPSGPTQDPEYDAVWLGRFHPQKGLFDLLEAASEIIKDKPDFKLAVIGGGDLAIEKKVLEIIQQNQLEDNVILLGPLFDQEKFSVLHSAKIYLMTSYFEGYCNVIVEALSQGVPVIAYNAPIHDVFDKGTVKVPMQNPSAMAKATLHLLKHEDERKRLAEQAFAAGQKHSWNYVAEETYKLVAQPLGETS